MEGDVQAFGAPRVTIYSQDGPGLGHLPRLADSGERRSRMAGGGTAPRLGFDPQLPELASVFDMDAVVQRFNACLQLGVRGSRSAGRVTAARLLDVGYWPAVRCVAAYELQVEEAGAAPRRTQGAVQVKPDDVSAWEFCDDPQLPWLSIATDRRMAADQFASFAGAGPVEVKAVAPTRYKPGARCVLRYDLHTPGGEQTWFGKSMANGSERLGAAVMQLHKAWELRPEMQLTPRLVGLWPAARMLVQEAVVEGCTLTSSLLCEPQECSAETALHSTGEMLATLHLSECQPGPARSLMADIGELDGYVSAIAVRSPDLARRYVTAVTTIALRAASQPEPAPVASHGAFRTDQVIMAGRPVLLDLDSFCLANPARDVGNFLAYLGWRAFRSPQDTTCVARLGQAFLAGYQAGGGRIDRGWLDVYVAVSLLKICGRRHRALAFHEWPLTPRLVETAFEIVRHGLGNRWAFATPARAGSHDA